MKHLKSSFLAPGLFCLALIVRILYNLTVARDYYPLSDSLNYQHIGLNLLTEHCFCQISHVTTVYRAPLWPWLIAGISLLAGRADLYDRLFLSLLGAATCVLLYAFARDLFTRRVGLIAGLIACFYPALYIYDGWLYTEALYTFLLLAVCYCTWCIQREKGQRIRLWIINGILLALLALSRPNALLVPLLILIWTLVLVWRRSLPRASLGKVLLTLVIASGLIAPWTIRNYLVAQSFIPVATGDGTVLLGAYNDQVFTSSSTLGSWLNPEQIYPQLLQQFPPATCNALCEVQRENVMRNDALQWIHTHLSLVPRLLLYHVLHFWKPDSHEADLPMYRFPDQLSSQVLRLLAQTFPLPIFLLAAAGLVITLKQRWQDLLFPYAILLATQLEALIFYGSSRFRSPIEPLLILFAASALGKLAQILPGRRGSPAIDKGTASLSSTSLT